MIREEPYNPMVVIGTQNLIENDPKLEPRYLIVQ